MPVALPAVIVIGQCSLYILVSVAYKPDIW